MFEGGGVLFQTFKPISDMIQMTIPFEEIQMTIPFEEARSLIASIPHEICQNALAKRWQAGGRAGVTAQSICWLFCWGKTGMGSEKAAFEAREVFGKIFNKDFKLINEKLDHEWTRSARYSNKDIESEFQRRL